MTDAIAAEWAATVATYRDVEEPPADAGDDVVVELPAVTPSRPEPRSSWGRRIDVSAAYRGEVARLEATSLVRDDGHGGFYPGRTNAIVGESETAKSWVALIASAQELAAGRTVAYIDFEDDALGVGLRLRDLGVPEDVVRDRFVYTNPDGMPDLDDFSTQFDHLGISHLTFDAMTTALGEAGLDPNRDVEVVRWIDSFARPIARRGTCVVILDHVGKDATRGARGSAAKREAITGTQLVAVRRALVAPGKRGVTSLMVGKDRGGAVRSAALNGTHFADVVIDAEPTIDGPPLRASVLSPLPDAEGQSMTRVIRALKSLNPTESNPVTTKDVQQATARSSSDAPASAAFLSTRRVQEALSQLHANGGVGRRDSGRSALWWVL